MKRGYQRTIKLLWHSGYWDGPISGVCEIDDKKYWFDQIPGESGELWIKYVDDPMATDDDYKYEYDITRFYKIYELPEEVMSNVVFNHELFRKYVGHHTDYVNNSRQIGMHPECDWEKYELEKKEVNIQPHITDANCVGWFDSNSR